MRTRISSVALGTALTLAAGTAQATWVQWTAGAGGNAHWYRLVDDGASGWTEARARAQTEFGGDLATITSAGEQQFITSALFGGSPPDEALRGSWWLGGTDATSEGTWMWVTGEPWSFTNWGESQPDNNTSPPFGDVNGEDHLQLVWRTDGTSPLLGGWNDVRETGYLASDPNFATLPNLWLRGFIVERTSDPRPRPEPVPAPPALPLFAAALLGLAAVRLRRA